MIREIVRIARRGMRLGATPPEAARAAWARGVRYQRPTSQTDRSEGARRRLRAELGATPRGAGAVIEQLVRMAAHVEPPPPLAVRFRARLLAECIESVRARGGETEIRGRSHSASLSVWDRRGGLTLVGAEGWRKYGARANRARLAYLCGRDDNGPWAVRVPGTLSSATGALEWIEPLAVRQARARGAKILRQGDIYAIEARRDAPPGALGRHRWDAAARVLYHDDPARPHAPMHVPFPCRFVAQRVYEMGRSGRRGAAD